MTNGIKPIEIVYACFHIIYLPRIICILIIKMFTLTRATACLTQRSRCKIIPALICLLLRFFCYVLFVYSCYTTQ